MDDLTLLEEGEAVRVFFDSRNARVLFRMLRLVAVWVLLEALIRLADGPDLQAARSAVSLVLIRWLLWVRERPFLTQHFRPVLLGYLTVQLVLLRVFDLDPAVSVQSQDYLLPFLLLPLRLRPAEAAIPLGALWAAGAGRGLLAAAFGGASLAVWQVVGQTAVSLIVLWWSGRLTRRLKATFLVTWRREHRRHRERRRMRGELDDARKIQLSMLPQRDPRISWLDIAGISIPASEVGGDYYDYFTVSESQQVVLVADVAGHGVASALLLSGIRSCLYLLHETPRAPREVLAKLDRMVRQTTSSRLFVTMFYALFDYERKVLTYSVAGHPPLLRYRADAQEVEEIGLQALPLGTALGNSLGEQTVPFHRDDILLFYTDGIAETLNGRQELYGNEKLKDRLRSTAHDRSAKEIRDTLLGDVWRFKGDGEQIDDITMVVVKVH